MFRILLATATAVFLAVGAAGAVGAVGAVGDQVKGEVVKIDKAAGKITLKHEPIEKFDMDSMTMVFRVANPAMLDKVKAGDMVEFEADRVNGALTVTKIGKGR